jgi:hypothetical protein
MVFMVTAPMRIRPPFPPRVRNRVNRPTEKTPMSQRHLEDGEDVAPVHRVLRVLKAQSYSG